MTTMEYWTCIQWWTQSKLRLLSEDVLPKKKTQNACIVTLSNCRMTTCTLGCINAWLQKCNSPAPSKMHEQHCSRSMNKPNTKHSFRKNSRTVSVCVCACSPSNINRLLVYLRLWDHRPPCLLLCGGRCNSAGRPCRDKRDSQTKALHWCTDI